MGCTPSVRNSESNNSPSCCSSTTAWSLTAVAGTVILALGIVFLVSVTTTQLGSLRNLMLKAAKNMGTTPIVLPILLSSVGGTVLLSAILGYANNCCTKNDASPQNLNDSAALY